VALPVLAVLEDPQMDQSGLQVRLVLRDPVVRPYPEKRAAWAAEEDKAKEFRKT